MVDGVAMQSGDGSNFGRFEIESKQPDGEPKMGLGNF